MKVARRAAGVTLIVSGVAIGAYVGLWICFIGGIVSVVDGFKATPTDGGLIAWGLLKACIFSTLSAAGAIFGLGGAGVALFKGRSRKSRGKSAGA